MDICRVEHCCIDFDSFGEIAVRLEAEHREVPARKEELNDEALLQQWKNQQAKPPEGFQQIVV